MRLATPEHRPGRATEVGPQGLGLRGGCARRHRRVDGVESAPIGLGRPRAHRGPARRSGVAARPATSARRWRSGRSTSSRTLRRSPRSRWRLDPADLANGSKIVETAIANSQLLATSLRTLGLPNEAGNLERSQAAFTTSITAIGPMAAGSPDDGQSAGRRGGARGVHAALAPDLDHLGDGSPDARHRPGAVRRVPRQRPRHRVGRRSPLRPRRVRHRHRGRAALPAARAQRTRQSRAPRLRDNLAARAGDVGDRGGRLRRGEQGAGCIGADTSRWRCCSPIRVARTFIRCSSRTPEPTRAPAAVWSRRCCVRRRIVGTRCSSRRVPRSTPARISKVAPRATAPRRVFRSASPGRPSGCCMRSVPTRWRRPSPTCATSRSPRAARRSGSRCSARSRNPRPRRAATR